MNKIVLSSIFLLAFVFTSCKKDDGTTNPPPQDINFSINISAKKTFSYNAWILDSLNNKTLQTWNHIEKIDAVNVAFEGYSDAIRIIKTDSTESDTSYMRVVNAKDIYEWTDTTTSLQKIGNDIKRILYKISGKGAWLPRVLLSKGNGAEYEVQPERTTFFRIDTLTIPIKFSVRAKNEGFENVNLSLGNIRAYKVKTVFNAGIFLGTVLIESVQIVNYTWICDELDYPVKMQNLSYTSPMFKMTLNGYVYELSSYQ
ncbi:MAG: hypothetical protein N3A61_06415 [Ignavibacteria bacterium]|nr:hypothetical protein [Ignavibacteria bacterium]